MPQGIFLHLVNDVGDANVWFYVFHILYAAEPALVRRFFDAAILLDRRLRTLVFQSTAPVAMSVDPTLSKYLVAMANKFCLAVPVAKPSVRIEELADNEKAGGNVHMRLLTRIDRTSIGFGCRASSTRKTVAHYGVQLHVAAGNVLDALSTSERRYLYIRNFEQAKARRGVLVPGRLHKVKIQHGDVVVVHNSATCPSFLKAEVDCTGLSREDCFERVKSFCRAARDKDVYFMAIVESDQRMGTERELVDAEKESSASFGSEDGRKRRELGNHEGRGSKRAKSVGQDELQES